VGNGVNKLLERALPEQHRNADMVSMLKVDFIQYYFTHSDEFTKPYPGITELVGRLYMEGYKLAVASNKVHAATVDLVKNFSPILNLQPCWDSAKGFP